MNKTTSDLEAELNQITDLQKYIKDNKTELQVPDPIQYLLSACNAKNISKSDLIRNSGLERTYGYHLLDGTKALTREKALALCFGAKLNAEEANKLLKYANLGTLYAREPRDVVIMMSLNKGTGLIETNLLLAEMQLKEIE